MQASIPLANLTLKQKIIAMVIGAFGVIALAFGLGTPAGASSGYDSYSSNSVDASALSVDATAFKEYTSYTSETLIVYYNKETYTNYVEFSDFNMNKADFSKDSYDSSQGYGWQNDHGDYKKHDNNSVY